MKNKEAPVSGRYWKVIISFCSFLLRSNMSFWRWVELGSGYTFDWSGSELGLGLSFAF